ncbi:hypothetical protein [Anabaena sp. CCY 9614]
MSRAKASQCVGRVPRLVATGAQRRKDTKNILGYGVVAIAPSWKVKS